MVFFFEDAKGARPLVRMLRRGGGLPWADFAAFILLAGLTVMVIHGTEQMDAPLAQLHTNPVTLDAARLPEYALRTTLRMFAALAASLVFTFSVATLAAKSRKAELIIVPALDILQSVPVLGFLSFTVTMFMGWFPFSQLGVECAAIFAIFTSQAWNMAFSFYQSLRTLPADLDEVTRQFGFSPWRRFVRLELPYAIPGLIWNMMMSMSGGWFFVVASEAITVGNTTVTLPGIGSWLSLAIAREDFKSVGLGVLAMGVVIVLYDQLVFRPIVAWADKFRFEQTASQAAPKSWVHDLIRRTRFLRTGIDVVLWPLRKLAALEWSRLPSVPRVRVTLSPKTDRALDAVWIAVVLVACAFALWQLIGFIARHLTWSDVVTTFGLGMVTLVRVVVLIALATLIWVPIGVWIGLRPAWSQRLQPIAQFLAAFPANVLFPFAVMAIVAFRLDPNIWLSPLMILGTQWYILFNVIAGASAIPGDMKEVAGIFGIRNWQWWRQIVIPAIFPYYVTGALTASGGCWNASIVAEVVTWGNRHLEAAGLGAFIANATSAGDYPRVALGIAVMSLFVIAFNRSVWRPMYAFAERRLRIN
ncbi:ABC transporter permease subunit [Asticcacaulis sp. 201]|uniref:ABC transporter permease n=1 Tax=Asticcacaulis sp. 201 TaxID=3028787 RepID=UPI0029170B38|nr:ABC transporter permease subunit [Asticcacaulis sp. 201]MDV6331960.1 ABC transporter permease subunit [Asticcacaulis sp. 201]